MKSSVASFSRSERSLCVTSPNCIAKWESKVVVRPCNIEERLVFLAKWFHMISQSQRICWRFPAGLAPGWKWNSCVAEEQDRLTAGGSTCHHMPPVLLQLTHWAGETMNKNWTTRFLLFNSRSAFFCSGICDVVGSLRLRSWPCHKDFPRQTKNEKQN